VGRDNIEESIRKYAEKVKSEFNPFAVYLFGSYAQGNADKDSDIDVAVIFKHFVGNALTTTGRLYSLTRGIDTRIEPHLFDIEEDDDFLYEVFRTGQNILAY